MLGNVPRAQLATQNDAEQSRPAESTTQKSVAAVASVDRISTLVEPDTARREVFSSCTAEAPRSTETTTSTESAATRGVTELATGARSTPDDVGKRSSEVAETRRQMSPNDRHQLTSLSRDEEADEGDVCRRRTKTVNFHAGDGVRRDGDVTTRRDVPSDDREPDVPASSPRQRVKSHDCCCVRDHAADTCLDDASGDVIADTPSQVRGGVLTSSRRPQVTTSSYPLTNSSPSVSVERQRRQWQPWCDDVRRSRRSASLAQYSDNHTSSFRQTSGQPGYQPDCPATHTHADSAQQTSVVVVVGDPIKIVTRTR